MTWVSLGPLPPLDIAGNGIAFRFSLDFKTPARPVDYAAGLVSYDVRQNCSKLGQFCIADFVQLALETSADRLCRCKYIKLNEYFSIESIYCNVYTFKGGRNFRRILIKIVSEIVFISN